MCQTGKEMRTQPAEEQGEMRYLGAPPKPDHRPAVGPDVARPLAGSGFPKALLWV